MATTLEMLIRAKYVSQGASTLESDLKNIQKAISELRKSSLNVDIDKFLPKPESIAGVERELAAVTERLNQYKQAALAAFGQGESGRGAGMAIEDTITRLEKYRNTLQKVIDSTKQKGFNAADYILSSSDVTAIEANIARVKTQLDSLRQSMAKATLGDDKEAASSFKQQIKELEAYRKIWEDTLKVTRSGKQVSPADMILSNQDVQNIKARAAQLRQELEGLRNALAKTTTSGGDTSGIKRNIQEVQAALNDLKSVVQGQKDGFRIHPDLLMSDSDVATVRNRIKAIEAEMENYKRAAAAMAAQNKDGLAKEAMNTVASLESQKKMLESTIPVMEKTGITIESMLTNKLTRLGFGIFALQSSLRTFTELAKGLFSALLEGASSLDRSRSFEILLSGQGIDSSGMKNRLEEAAQGLVTLDRAMASTIEFAKAGFPQIAQQSDKLLRIATDAAIVSGDLSQVLVIYEKLSRGIMRGSPRLIDDSGIIIKLGNANEQYAASLGKTVEQLTAADTVMSTWNATLKEGERIHELAQQMDSTAVKVAKLKTEWQEFTESFKEGLAIVAISDDEIDGSVKKITLAVKSFTELSKDDRIALVERLFTSAKGWGVLLSGSLLIIKELISAVVTDVKYFAQIFKISFDIVSKGAQVAGLSFEYLQAKMSGLTRRATAISAEITALTGDMKLLGDAAFVLFNSEPPGFTNFGNNLQAKLDEMLEAAGFIEGKARTGVDITGIDGQATTGAAEETTNELGKLLRERAAMAEDIEYERVTKVRDINRDHADKMRDIARKLAETLADINRDLNEKLADLEQDRLDKLADIAQDLADKIADIDQDLADKLADVQQDANEKRADAEEDYRQGVLDAEEEYQKKLRDIQRKYEASRLQALIDRDARGLFEAQKQREQDLEDAAETAEEKKNEELEKLQEKLEDINRQEEEQRQDAIRSAEERRRDAQQAAERARRDAIQNYERARRDAQDDAERRRRDARENAARERREALIDQAEARQDLQDWYRDKLRDLVQYHQDELQQYGQHYSNINDLTGEFMQSQADAWAGFMEGNRTWIGIGNPLDPETGEEWPDWRNPSNVYQGGRCNRGSSQVTTGADGRRYICVGNRWQVFNGVAGAGMSGVSSVGAGGIAGQGSFSSIPFGASGGGERIKVVIEGKGDDALNQIIKSGAYEAYLEIMS